MLTNSGEAYDNDYGGRIKYIMERFKLSEGKAKLLHNISDQFSATAVASLGEPSKTYSETENLDQCKESIRVAAAAGARALQDSGIEKIFVEAFRNAGAAAEGALLATWRYQDLKQKNRQKTECTIDFFNPSADEEWNRGYAKAECQNIARMLAEKPANIKTPMGFSQSAVEILCPCGVSVEIKDRDWMDDKQMIPALAVARGSCHAPLFLELSYCGGSEDDKPVILIGKGMTFDSGGLCLRPCEGMGEHRADVAGGAAIVGIMKALAVLNLPINVNGLIPLMENMPGGAAVKPGDVVLTKTGRSIKIENPAYAGRVTLSSALIHAASFSPCLVINIATLTSGETMAMGSVASPTFSTSDVVWRELKKAAAETGDRVWRMPFWDHFTKNVTELPTVDVDNVGLERGAPLCKAAAFLLEFAPKVDFAYIDISGTGREAEDCPIYYRKGLMTGRPVRTIVQFLSQMACPQDIHSSPC
ncbi:cytosol aminopeptidase-like isoform X2 [Cimex lectularius]|nr:cytosol aminopeptidase-like isoform X2 [Cimex lectularius]